VLSSAIAAALAALAAAGPAAADSMVVQPDGKIVLTGEDWPGVAALARLDPDGSPDAGFGEGGFVLDRRLPPVTALALQPDGRIIAGGVGGFQLARYLPNGAVDPSFAGGGVGGTVDPRQVSFLYEDYRPDTILVRPDGAIVVGGTQEEQVRGSMMPQAVVRRYDSNGGFLETVGHLAGEEFVESHLNGLAEQADGSLVGAGWTWSTAPGEGEQVMLARFLPGSGTAYDPSFGNGAGLVRLPRGEPSYYPIGAWDVVVDDGGLLAAGESEGAPFLARFSADGVLDPAFGAGAGFVRPAISGTSEIPSFSYLSHAGSWANDIAVAADDDIVLGGGTSQWSSWQMIKNVGPVCARCPQPLLVRFDSAGRPDPSFGNGGVLRLLRPDGGILEGEVEEVVALADGKLLVKGTGPVVRAGVRAPFLARLNADGSYDPGFGNGGWTTPGFPCLKRSAARLRREGCLPSVRVKLRVTGLREGRPGLSLQVRPREGWARIRRVVVRLPQRMRPVRGFRKRARVVAVDGASERGRVHARKGRNGNLVGPLTFERLGSAREMRASLPVGSLEFPGGVPRNRKLAFELQLELIEEGGFDRPGRLVLKVPAG
jgi:uncharacterized delta-60 repeat protein